MQSAGSDEENDQRHNENRTNREGERQQEPANGHVTNTSTSMNRAQHTDRNTSGGEAENEERRLRDPEAIYNIGMVERITRIPAATLRAWERRYGFPHARRTAGGHRLYSERDIQLLRLVKYHIDRGMQTAQAVRVVRKYEQQTEENQGEQPDMHTPPLPTTGSTAATPVTKPATSTDTTPATSEGMSEGGEAVLENMSEQLIAAFKKHDLQEADRLMGEMLAFYSPEELILRVFAPAMNRIGQLWSEGRISVATEHLSSGYIRHRLLIWLVSGPPPRHVPPVVLACAPGEWHEGSLLMLAVLLRRRRWPVSYLGQSVPMADLADFVRDIRPSVVVLAAMAREPVAAIAEWPMWLPEAAATGRPVVGFGGLAFNEHPELIQHTPGIYLGPTLEQGLHAIERLLEAHAHPGPDALSTKGQ
jgi:DNA-binding transcriptional MerR regulator